LLPADLQISVIEGCRKGESKAQQELFRYCYPVFMKICLRYTKSYDDAANVLQDAFVKIFTRLNSYNERGDFVGWMKRIVVNTAIDHVRKRKKEMQVRIEQWPDIRSEEDEEPDFIVDEKQLLSMIRSLPDMQSTVFNLFVMENYSHHQIGEALGINIGQSKWYLHDARKMLREKINNMPRG
jgi:RNA polymerase sigma-70 factor, ECF subfamily